MAEERVVSLDLIVVTVSLSTLLVNAVCDVCPPRVMTLPDPVITVVAPSFAVVNPPSLNRFTSPRVLLVLREVV